MNHPGVRTRDIERIKNTLSEEFRTVFTDSLESSGFPVVEQAAEHVLLIRPAIIDLDSTTRNPTKSSRARSIGNGPATSAAFGGQPPAPTGRPREGF